MRKHIHSVRETVLPVIDFFYPPFGKWMGKQTFRYAASGGLNTLLGFAAYFICYKYILKGENFDAIIFIFKPHIAALFFSFCISFPFGFFLMKYIVFDDSKMNGSVQLIRYFMVYLFNLALNYLLLKVSVEILHINPVLAQIITTIVIVLFSYVAQRNFTFKIKNEEDEITS